MKIRTDYLTLQNFSLLLLLFFVIFDPGNIHFGLKNISFLFFCIANIKKLSGKLLLIPLLFISFFFTSYAHGLIIQTPLDIGIANWNLSSFLFLFILLYINSGKIKFLYDLYYLALIFSIYIVFCALFVFLPNSNFLGNLVWEHVTHNNDFIMVGFRRVLGLIHPCLYYRTASICIIPTSISLILLAKSKNKKYLLHFLLFFGELFISGARANILAAILILISFIFAYLFYEKKKIIICYILFLSAICLMSFILFGVLTEKEHSNLTKLGHAQSFYELFNSNFLRYFFLGSGPGTIMYSYGIHQNTALTELSYFEMIKGYGVIPSLIMILVFLIPVYGLWKSKNEKMIKVSIILSYFSFFFVAGTNPLFVGSTGFTTIICMFYLYNKNILSEFDIHIVNKKTPNKLRFLKGLI